MKRIAQFALALLLAFALLLPTAAIINVDGSDPEWTGESAIVPAMEDNLGLDDDTLYNDGYVENWQDSDRHPLARDGDIAIDPIDAPVPGIGGQLANDCAPCMWQAIASYAALGLAALALLLAIIALAKIGRKTSGTKIKNDFF